jgi:hypothetical protein
MMKMLSTMRAIMLSIVLLFTIGLVHAQNITIATVQWNASLAMNAQSGEIIDDPGFLVTTSNEKLEWKKQDGSERYSFAVKEVIGSWTNLNQPGEVTYEIAGAGGNGTATIKKTNEDTRIRLLIANEGEQQLFELTILTLQVK